MTDEITQLRPARPDPEGKRPSYMPRLPWKWIGGLGLFFSLSIGTCQIRERQEVAAMKASVLKAQQTQLGSLATRYNKLAGQVYRFTTAAGQRRPESYVDPRLKLSVLGSGKGVYLRLKANDAVDTPHIQSGGLDMQPDAIPACLGLSPVWFPELYAHGTFLEPRFTDQAKSADTVLKLRVIAEELRQRSQRDLPFVAEALNAQWFMLVLERGDNRRDAPVDAYIWDLRDDTLLFSGSAQADGVLVSARIAVAGTTPGQYAAGKQSGAAQDCSIAAKLRALSGADAPTSFESEPPSPRAALAAPGESDAGASLTSGDAAAH